MHEPDNFSLRTDINYKVSSFINTFTLIIFIAMGISIVGVVMKYYDLTGGGFVFVFSLGMLAFLFLIQICLSFFYVYSHFKLALVGAFSSMALALGFLALALRYQNLWGWQVMFIIAIPVFIVTSVFIGYFISGRQNHHHYSHGMHSTHRKFVFRNLLLPYMFLVLLSFLSFVIDREEFKAQLIQDDYPAQTKEDTDLIH